MTMERKTAHDFDQELLILFDAYVHGGLDRRGFLVAHADVPDRALNVGPASTQ